MQENAKDIHMVIMSGIYTLWAELPQPRKAADRLPKNTGKVEEEIAKYGKSVSKKTRRALQ